MRLVATAAVLILAAGAGRADPLSDKLCPILAETAAGPGGAPELAQMQLITSVADAYGYDHDALQAVLDGADAATEAACPEARAAVLAATRQPSLFAAMR